MSQQGKGSAASIYSRALSPRTISYRSITAATPIRSCTSSLFLSTRITRPWARTKTSVPRVISRGNVRVKSSSWPASNSLLVVKYTPRVETSRVWPLCGPGSRFCGVRTLTGSDKSYRRAVRRSVVLTVAPPKCTEEWIFPAYSALQSEFQNIRTSSTATDCQVSTYL
jgi:hypothetical protein